MSIGKHFVIALEEHYWDPEVAEHFTGNEGRAPALRAIRHSGSVSRLEARRFLG